MKTKQTKLQKIETALAFLGIKKFDQDESAQDNLSGKNYYCSADTVKKFKSKIIYTSVTDNGLILGIVERLPFGSFDAPRKSRAVVFDVFGGTIERSGPFNTNEQARRAMWDIINKTDGETVAAEKIKREIMLAKEKIAFLRKAGF